VAAGDDAQADVARQMQAQARRALDEADVVVAVHAPDAPAPWLPRAADLVVRTKADLPGTPDGPALRVSAHTGQGLAELLSALDDAVFGRTEGDRLTVTARQHEVVARAEAALARVAAAAGLGPEFAAAELRSALDALGDVRGVVTPDDVLGRVFSGFCVGK
jgi:tRNA modification GTPase